MPALGTYFIYEENIPTDYYFEGFRGVDETRGSNGEIGVISLDEDGHTNKVVSSKALNDFQIYFGSHFLGAKGF